MIDQETSESGWYPDPAGIHHLRYWSGHAWTARVADRYGSTSAHHVEGRLAPPTAAAPGQGGAAPTPPRPVAAPSLAPRPAPVPPVRQPPSGWQPDPFGRFAERYFVAGQPSQVVRTGGIEAIDPTFTTRPAGTRARRSPQLDEKTSRTLTIVGAIAGILLIALLLAALRA